VTNRQPQGRSTTHADCRWHGKRSGFDSLSSPTAKAVRLGATSCQFESLVVMPVDVTVNAGACCNETTID
jgi:hypothetical protein